MRARFTAIVGLIIVGQAKGPNDFETASSRRISDQIPSQHSPVAQISPYPIPESRGNLSTAYLDKDHEVERIPTSPWGPKGHSF